MKAIVVGGGKVGYYLLKTLREKNYDVTLIEKDRNLCNKIAEDIGGHIICGDGSDVEVLKDADIEEAEVVAAVTGKDEENLVVCQMAKVNFNVGKTIARINNPKNRGIFKALGVDNTVCSTEVIANLIEGEFDSEELRIVQTLDKGEMILLEVPINKKSAWKNKVVRLLELPRDSVIVSIIRKDHVVFPRGDIEIKEGDKVLLVTNAEEKINIERAV
jgi:trk system potassium uptake protein TrkA